jgi:hypothetical protein
MQRNCHLAPARRPRPPQRRGAEAAPRIKNPCRGRCSPMRLVRARMRRSEKDAKLAQKLGQLRLFVAVFSQECTGQLACQYAWCALGCTTHYDRSEKGVRLAPSMPVGPCIPVGVQL